MRTLICLLCFISSFTSLASEWGLGPISLGDRLGQVEKALGVKSEFASGCAVVSLNKTQANFPFFATPYRDVELWFSSTKKESLLGVIVLEFSPENFESLKSVIENFLSQKAESNEGIYVYKTGSVTWTLDFPQNLMKIRQRTFACTE
jgi:hypothetical protein